MSEHFFCFDPHVCFIYSIYHNRSWPKALWRQLHFGVLFCFNYCDFVVIKCLQNSQINDE